jgi:diadenylate cyclase
VQSILENITLSLRLWDAIDVLIVAFLLYRFLLLIRGTRAVQMLMGLGIIGSAFFLSSKFELFTTHWILSYFTDYLIVIVIVLFQDDLRRALSQAGRNPFSGSLSQEVQKEIVEEVITAAFRLARERIGALIVIERNTGLKNFVDTGSVLDSLVSSEVIFSIFIPSSPIHDGAVIINRGRLAAAGCFLPLSSDPNIDKRYGSRHRAALGISEQTDAIVVLVSEETGEVHLVKGGKIATNLGEGDVRQSLSMLLELTKPRVAFSKRVKRWFWTPKRG